MPGHKYSETVLKEPSCISKGTVRKSCTVCGSTYTGSIPKAAHDSDVYQQIAAEEDAANIRAAIDALSDSQKDLIQKIFDEGMSIKDYAEACGVKPSAISHRIRTIRNNLKEILK